MAFFGSNASEKELAQLKKVMNQKDLQLTSLQNEQHKKQEEIAELKKVKDTAIYNLQVEAERAFTAETALTLRNNELNQAKLRLANLESSLNAANERIQTEKKENQKLQYRSSQSSSKRVQDQEATLQAQIVQLKQDLMRSEREKETIRHEAAVVSSGGWGINEASMQSRTGTDKAQVIAMENEISTLRTENVRLMAEARLSATSLVTATSSNFNLSDSTAFGSAAPVGTTASSSPRTRRRASSVSMIPRLESQIQELRSQVDNSVSGTELEGIRSQLASAKKHANKMENEKMALERKARNDVEGLRSKLDDARDELNFFRRAEDGTGSDVSKKQLDDLSAQVAQLQRKLEVKAGEVEQLQAQVERLHEIEVELADEKDRVASLETQLQSAAVPSANEEDLEAKIAILEQQVASTTSSRSTESGSSDRKVRQLQRDLAGLQDELNESDRLLAEKEEQIFALRTCLPIPGSPTLSSLPSGTNGASELDIEGIRAECATHKQTILEKEEKIEYINRQLRVTESEATDRLEAYYGLRTELQEMTETLEISRHDIKRLHAQAAEFGTLLSEKSLEIVALKERIAASSAVAEQVEHVQAQLSEALEHTQSLDAELNERAIAIEQLRDDLRRRSHDDVEFEALSRHAEAATSARSECEVRLESVQAALVEVQAAMLLLRSEKEAVESVSRDVQIELEQATQQRNEMEHQRAGAEGSLREQLTEAEGSLISLRLDASRLQSASEEASEMLAAMEAYRDDLMQENGVIAADLALLQDAVADRSTVSDARERDVSLFRKEQELEALQSKLKSQTSEAAEELRLVSFEKEELATASEDLRQRVSGLASEVSQLREHLASSPSPPDAVHNTTETEVEQLLSAIDRLRAERDGLRQSLNFATHESKFAIETLSNERTTAILAYDDIKRQLEAAEAVEASQITQLELHTARISALELESSEHIDALNDNFAQKEELVMQIEVLQGAEDGSDESVSALKTELEAVADALASTQQQLAAADQVAQHRLSELEKARATAGEDVRQLLAERVQTTARPAGTAARQLKHDLDEQIQRVGRRDAQIASHQAELKRLKLNRDLMVSSMDELTQELADANDALAQESDARAFDNSALDAARAQAYTFEKAIATANERLKGLQNEIDALRGDKDRVVSHAESSAEARQSNIISLVLHAVDSGRASSDLLVAKGEIDALQRSAAASRALVQSLRQEKASIESKLVALVEELSTLEASSHIERVALEGQLEAAQVSAAAAEAVAAEAHSEVETLRAELATAIDAFKATESQASAATSHELDEAREQLSIVKTTVKSLEATISQLKNDIDGHRSALDVAERTVSEHQKAVERHMAAAVSAKDTIEDLQGDLAIARVQKERADSENNMYQTSLQEAQATAASSLGEQDRLLKALAVSIEEKALAEAATSTAQLEAAKITRRLDAALAEVAAAAEISSAAGTRSVELAATVADLEIKIQGADGLALAAALAQAEGRQALEQVQAEHATAAQQLQALQGELHSTQARVDVLNVTNAELHRQNSLHSATQDALRRDAILAQKEGKQAIGLLKFEESKGKNLSESLQAAHIDLAAAHEEAADAVSQARATQISVSKLVVENSKLQATLKVVVAPKASEQGDLVERIAQLEAMLNQKLQEVDEADDKVRDAYKANARLEKKIAKLERKLLLTAPVETPPVTAAPVAEIQQRATPRAINVFEPPVPVLAGGKRGREEAEVERLPADAIMQPPAFTPSRTPLTVRRAPVSRLGFTPTRRVSGEPGLKSTTPSRTPGVRSAFGTDITNGTKAVDAPMSDAKPFAALPRNAFSVAP